MHAPPFSAQQKQRKTLPVESTHGRNPNAESPCAPHLSFALEANGVGATPVEFVEGVLERHNACENDRDGLHVPFSLVSERILRNQLPQLATGF